ncbi:MAG: helix-turn-helix domain-containing protein [Bacillus sp. (in: firmicutes)]
MKEYVTISDICSKYGISRKTVERWIATRSLPAIKLNTNNGSIRVNIDAFEKWINAQNDLNPIKKLHWCEFELKYKISFDLNEEKKSLNSIVSRYDNYKTEYPQDFFISLKNNSKVLVNIRPYSEDFSSQSFRQEVTEKFIKQYGKEINLLILEIDINANQVKVEDQTFENVKFKVLNSGEILEFDIMEELAQIS